MEGKRANGKVRTERYSEVLVANYLKFVARKAM